jgi:hypothetical protein
MQRQSHQPIHELLSHVHALSNSAEHEKVQAALTLIQGTYS